MDALPEAREKVVTQLRKMIAVNKQNDAMTDETEVFYDLGLSGLDLLEFLGWVSKEFSAPDVCRVRRARERAAGGRQRTARF